MTIYYEGADITSRVQIAEAIYKDVSGGRSDSLDMVFENGLAWNVWQPQKNDRVQIVDGSLDTGTLFVQAVMPMGNQYRIIATAAKAGAGQKKTKSYEDITLSEILGFCAAENGMEYRIYGIEKETAYKFLIQEDEGNAKFLSRIAQWEGATIKTYNGRYTMIGIEAAQALDSCETIALSTSFTGFTYRKKYAKARSMKVICPWAQAEATDNDAAGGEEITISHLPAWDAGSAARWARGLLLCHNRKAEELSIETDLHPNWSAMRKITVTGQTEASGDWLVDEVTHDLIERKSKATFFRVIGTVR